MIVSNTEIIRAKLTMIDDEFCDAVPKPSEALVFHGTRFVLPKNMTLEGAITFLEAKRDEQQGVAFKRLFDFRPWDGAAATARVLDAEYGGYAQHSGQDMFGNRIPASKVSVPTSLTETFSVPWYGQIAVAALPDCVFTLSSAESDKGFVFSITVQAPPTMETQVNAVFDRIQTELEANSIYRGQAFDGADMPNFLDLDTIDPSKVVYSDEVLTQLDANVWSLMRYPEVLTDLGVPLKRAVLFEGPYGTGKTLAAYLTAREAVANGWTFVYCRPAQDNIEEALQTARLYEPCVVFFEDLDTIAEAGDKQVMTRLLDAFDGIQNKGTRILAIVTTNHVDEIHKGMLRPGRLDAVISVGALDRPGVEKLVRSTVAPEHLDPAIDFDRVYDACKDMMPAFVRESIERTMRYAIVRSRGKFATLTTDDFVHAMVGMRPQLELMDGAVDKRSVPTLNEVHSRLIAEECSELLLAWIKPIYDDYDVPDHTRPEAARR